VGVTVNTADTASKPAPIAYAQHAARCAHVKYNGETCGCPALKGKPFCRFHNDDESTDLVLPFVEDAAALQLAIMRIVRLLETDMIDTRKATAQLYALQLASSNLANLRNEMPADPAAGRESLTLRVLRLLDPPLDKHPLFLQEITRLVSLL